MQKFIGTMLGFLLLSACSFHSTAQWPLPDNAAQWSAFDEAQDNYYSLNIPREHPHLLWSRNSHASISSSAVISQYNLVTFTNNASSSCTIFTLMLDSGRKDFCRNLTRDNAKNFPLVDRFGNIYTGNHNQLLAYDWYGPLRWSIAVQGIPISTQFIAPDILITLTDNGMVYEVEAHLGKILSEGNLHLLANETFSAPLHVDREHSIVWINSNLSVYAIKINPSLPPQLRINFDEDPRLDPTQCFSTQTLTHQIRLIWQYHQESTIRQILFSSHFQRIYLLRSHDLMQINPITSKTEWKYDIADALGASIDRNGNIFVTSSHGIRRINFTAQSQNHRSDNILYSIGDLWNQPIPQILSHPIALSNGNILLITSKLASGHHMIQLLCLAGNTGKQLAKENFIDNTDTASNTGEIAIAHDGIMIITLSDGEVLGIR